MPRPTTPQLAYGSLTVVLFTLATLLLADVRSGAAVVAVATGGLLLGLLVAVVLAAPSAARRRASLGPAPLPPAAVTVPRSRVTGSAVRERERSLRH